MTKIPLTFGPPDVTVERRADGAMIVRSPQPLGPYPQVDDRLARPLGERRARPGLPRRAAGRRLAQGDLRRGARHRPPHRAGDHRPRPHAERPVAILSGNSVDHALIGLGAMIAGVPYAPVSPPYSLVAKDFGKLKSDPRRS